MKAPAEQALRPNAEKDNAKGNKTKGDHQGFRLRNGSCVRGFMEKGKLEDPDVIIKRDNAVERGDNDQIDQALRKCGGKNKEFSKESRQGRYAA